ncbi:MAG TPA: hypothetical protein VKB48_03560 [Candidatus Acidoferrum sp.]|nr:hypothetical protein [Candidatus Acidoferrum sp.]
MKAAAIFVVEERGKYSGGIEVGVAKKIDRAIYADECNGAHVADDTVIFDGLKAHRPWSRGWADYNDNGFRWLRGIGQFVPMLDLAFISKRQFAH